MAALGAAAGAGAGAAAAAGAAASEINKDAKAAITYPFLVPPSATVSPANTSTAPPIASAVQ